MPNARCKNNKLNNSINIFRFICAFLVVAIHTHPLMDINDTLGFMVTKVIPRIAVPFFFIVSGYFYYEKIKENEKVFFTYFKRLFVTYCIWSVIYLILYTLQNTHEIVNLSVYIIVSVKRFLFFGLYYHLWYIPALFIGIILMTFFKKINQMKLFYLITILLYVIGTLSSAYIKKSSDLYLMNCLINLPYYDSIRNVFFLGIPFFACGYIVHVIRSKIKKVGLGVVFFGVLTVVEIAFVHIKLENSFIITFALYPLVAFILLYLLKHPYASMRKSSDSCRKISGFVYYSHPLIIFFLNSFFSFSETPIFIFTSMICTVLGILIVKINNKYLMKLL